MAVSYRLLLRMTGMDMDYQKTKLGGRAPLPPPPPTVWCRKTLLLMFSTIPVTSVTSERTFSALRRPKEHQEAGPPEQLRTDLQSIKDTLDNAKIAKRIACANEQRKRTFWKIWAGVCVWLSGRWALPPTFQNALQTLLWFVFAWYFLHNPKGLQEHFVNGWLMAVF